MEVAPANKVFSHHQPSTTFASHGFHLSLDVSCSPHNALWSYVPFACPGTQLSCACRTAASNSSFRNGFCTTADRCSAGDRDISADDERSSCRIPADPSKRSAATRRKAEACRASPVLFLQRSYQYPESRRSENRTRSTSPINVLTTITSYPLCRSTSAKTAPNTTSASTRRIRPVTMRYSRCPKVLSWRLSKLDA